jgi:hypothetical protein
MRTLVAVLLVQAAAVLLVISFVKSLRRRLDEVAVVVEMMAQRQNDRPSVLAAVEELKSIVIENRPATDSTVADGDKVPTVPIPDRRAKYGPYPGSP